MKLMLIPLFILSIYCSKVFAQLFDEINANQLSNNGQSQGYDDFSNIVSDNQAGPSPDQQPRFSEAQKNDPDFLQSLASQAQSLITHKFGGAQNSLQPPNVFPRPGSANNIDQTSYRGSDQGSKGFLPKELRDLEVVESEKGIYKELGVEGIRMEKNKLIINSDVKIKIGESEFSIPQIEALVYFNMKLLKKCGKNLEYCMIRDNTDDLEYKSLETKENEELKDKKSKDRFLEINSRRLNLLDQENEKLEKELNNLAELTYEKSPLGLNPKFLEEDVDIY